MSDAQIYAKELSKSYREGRGQLPVLEKLTCHFEPGKSVAILGKSGVGKSTLLHLLGGLDRPSSGKVMYGSTDIFSLNDDELTKFRAANVGFIFQFHHLLPEFNALENVAMPLVILGESDSRAQAKAAELLTTVGLKDRLDHRPSQLSGGEQQRVAIARALVARPRVILADEPTGNLDHETANQVQSLLTGMCREAMATLVVVTHNVELAKCLDRQIEMKPGGMLESL